jgi:hypothetical protein
MNDFSVGDFIKFKYSSASGSGVGRVIDISEGINGISLSVYCVDITGGYKLTVPHYNVIGLIREDSKLEDIKKPSRYNKRGKLECWDVILDQEMNFLEGNIIKYVWRYKEKNGIEDLKKAKVYLDKLIAEVEKK